MRPLAPEHVGVLTTSYPRFPGDFAGAFVQTRVRQLLRSGATVHVLAAGDDSMVLPPEPRLTVTRVPFDVPGGPDLFYSAGAPEALANLDLRLGLSALRFFSGMATSAQTFAKDWTAIESHWLLPCGLVAAALADRRLPPLPHRAHAHSGDVSMLERLPLALGRTLVARLGHAHLVAVSTDLHARLSQLGATSITIEPAPVDADVFNPASAQQREQARTVLGFTGPVFLGVGRLVPIKGFDLLLRATAHLQTPCTVVLIGDGPERERLQKLASDLHIKLILTGPLPPQTVALYMAAATAVVLPSRTLPDGRVEGAPLVAREALARGVAVIATATGGLNDLAGHMGVTIIPDGNPAALALALEPLAAKNATTDGRCDRCGSYDATAFDGGQLCSDCYATFGSCCNETICGDT